MQWALAVVGLAIGALVAYLLTRSAQRDALAVAEKRASVFEAVTQELRGNVAAAREQIEKLRGDVDKAGQVKAAAEARAAAVEKNIAEQKALLEEARAQLTAAFRALASEALSQSNTDFLALAEQKFKALRESAANDLEARRTAIEQLVGPVAETLKTYQDLTQQLEERRLREVSAVGQQLRDLAQAQSSLQQETAKLVNALRTPHVRGSWGEIALRKTAELAGMSKYCDFVEQATVHTENGRVRPDMVVHLPAGREVVVDSKVPLQAFLEALEAKTDQQREEALNRHVSQVHQHINALSSKQYWDQFPAAPEFVVLFIPNDSFLAAAAERDPSLIETALQKQVVIATPTTFIALLKAIAFGWRQEQIAESAQHISELGQELSDRMATLVEHITRVGSSLGKAVEAYNAAVGSLESKLLPQARKFKQLGADGKKEIEQLDMLDVAPRAPAVEVVPRALSASQGE
jgi:DNA recombination protein RmuC